MLFDIDKIIDSKHKNIRKLISIWEQLVKPENFSIPETMEELKQFLFLHPKINLKGTECYFNNTSSILLREFSNILYEISELNKFISYNSIYSTTLSYVEKAVLRKLEGSFQPSILKDIKKIVGTLESNIREYEFCRSIKGLELKGIDYLSFGNVQIFLFQKKHYEEFKKKELNNDQKEFYNKRIVPFLDKHFLNNLCIRTTAVGDKQKAKELAMEKFYISINILRSFVCLIGYNNIHRNVTKINLLSESYESMENEMCIHHKEKAVSIQCGIGRKSMLNLPIDHNLLKDLKDNYFLDDLCSIVTKKNKTEVEKTILTCLHWIGEAQNDFDPDSAFVKYWTAIETIFSKTKNESLRQSLAKGIAIMLAFGGYGIIKPKDVYEYYKKAKKLYGKRSKILHRGSLEKVLPKELSGICKYAIWCFFSCLGLRSKGYQTLDQINNEKHRLFNLTNYKYLSSKNSNIFHHLNCKQIKKINLNNIIGFSKKDQVVQKNMNPCKFCNP